MSEGQDREGTVRTGMSWRGRVVIVLFVALAIAIMWVTNMILTDRYTASTKNRSELRQALYAGQLMSELERAQIVPLLLARDPVLIANLNSEDYSQSSQRLISLKDEIGAASILMIDRDGRVVAATDRSELKSPHRTEPYFLSALRSNDTVFNEFRTESGLVEFTYSRRIEESGELIGVIVVEVDLRQFETTWSSISDAVFVTDSEGLIILATESP